MFERALAVVCLAGALLVSLALTGAFEPAQLPGAYGSQYCPADQYGTPTGDCLEDTTPPLISSTVTPGPNDNGWNNTNVTLVFNATDESGGSGVRSINCNLGGTTDGATRGIVFTAATVDTDVTCTAMDWAGNVSDPATRSIRIDKVRPSIGVGTRSPAPDLYGWNNTDVTVTWPCSDAFSGPATPTVSRTLSTNGAFQSATGLCTDLAGNQTSGTVGGISIDKSLVVPSGGPPNDNIANATVVGSLPFSGTTDTTTATRETHEPTCFGTPDDRTVWYRFTANQTGFVRVSRSGGSSAATPLLSVWQSFSTGLSIANCNPFGPAGPLSAFAVNLQRGATYFIKVGSQGSGTGPVTLALDPVLPPVNDAFENAKIVDALPFSDQVDLTAATAQTGEPRSPSGFFVNATAWYRFTPAQDEDIVVGGTATAATPVLALYTGSSLTGLTQVAGSFGFVSSPGGAFLRPVVFHTVSGTTYFIQVSTPFVSSDNRLTIGIERPVVFQGQVPAPNASGWNNADVTLSWQCSSLLAGFGSPTASQTITSEGSNQAATGFCFTALGTVVSDTETGVSIDKTRPFAPTAAADRPPDFVGGGWYKDVATVTFTDNGDPDGANGTPGSGSDPSTLPAPVVVTANGSTTVSGTVKDLAGNESAQGSLTVRVDSVAPSLSVSFANADGSPYTPGTWTNQAVTATFSCDDTGGSGLASTGVPQTVSTQGVDQSVTGSCTDNVGHVTTKSFGGIDIDLTPPEASFRFDPPTLGFVLTGTDQGGSGISGDPVAPAAVGGKGSAQTLTYTLTDGAGNTLALAIQTKPADGALQANVTSLAYNGAAPVAAPFTSLLYSWKLSKDGSLASLNQNVTIGKGASQRTVLATWTAKGNETMIVDGSTTATRPGLVALRVSTRSGALLIDY